MKPVLTLLMSTLFLLVSLSLFSQELNVGGVAGTTIESGQLVGFSAGGAVEFRPVHGLVSFSAEPRLLFYQREAIFTFPLYLRFIFGKKFRIGPVFGGFIRSSGNYGWSAGGEAGFRLKDKGILFVRTDFVMDYWRETYPWYHSSGEWYTDNGSSVLITLGFRKNILKNRKKQNK